MWLPSLNPSLPPPPPPQPLFPQACRACRSSCRRTTARARWTAPSRRRCAKTTAAAWRWWCTTTAAATARGRWRRRGWRGVRRRHIRRAAWWSCLPPTWAHDGRTARRLRATGRWRRRQGRTCACLTPTTSARRRACPASCTCGATYGVHAVHIPVPHERTTTAITTTTTMQGGCARGGGGWREPAGAGGRRVYA